MVDMCACGGLFPSFVQVNSSWLNWSLFAKIRAQVSPSSPNLNFTFSVISGAILFLRFLIYCRISWVIGLILECFGTLGTWSNHVLKPSTFLQVFNPKTSPFKLLLVILLKIFDLKVLGWSWLIFRLYEALGTYLGTTFYRFLTST